MFPTQSRAQSNTVGVVTLVAVFLVTATVVGLAVVDNVETDDRPLISADFEANGTDLTLRHVGGDAAPNGELTVVIDAGSTTTRLGLGPPDERFALGDEREFEDVLSPGTTTDVKLVHLPSGAILDEGTVQAPDEPAETGAIEGTVTGDEAATLRGSGASFILRRSLAPISGVTVTVEGSQSVTEATTTADGGYRVDGLSPGSYEVSATAAGFGVATATASVTANETTTVDLQLDPLEPAAFDVEIARVDRRVDAGDPVTVDAAVENVGDERGTETVELLVGGEAVDSAEVALDPGENRTVSLRWQTLPTDAGETELTVASEDDTARATVDVRETDAVAYLDRDGDGDAEETYTAGDLAFPRDVEGHLVVFDNAAIGGPVSIAADRITVEDGVTLEAGSIDLTGRDRVSLAGSTLDTSGGFFADAGDVTVRSGGDIGAAGAIVRATDQGIFTADAGDITFEAQGDVDVSGGFFDASAGALLSFPDDGSIRIASDSGTVTTTDTEFEPEPTIESGGG